MEDYIDLTNPNINLEEYLILADGFNCRLCNSIGKPFKGFLLAKSNKGQAYTICTVDFQWSKKDNTYPARIRFRRTDTNLLDKKVGRNQEYATVSFESGSDGYREFWEMIAFLSKFKEVVELSKFFRRYQIVTIENVVSRLNKKQPSERIIEIAEYVEKTGLSDLDVSEMLALRARKKDVEVFHQLLYDINGKRAKYRETFTKEVKGAGDEAIWHHFLKKHKWIFGLSLNIRFIEDFLDEQSVGVADTESRGSPRVDLLGYSDYTVLIELKAPQTNMFTPTKSKNARTNTWSFSNEFIEGFSQCLAQKSDLEKSSDIKSMVSEGKRLDRGVIRTIDPQAIFIVGNKEHEIPRDSDEVDIQVKRDTLERFIRNNRNVNIISFDELYRRACHIAQEEPLMEPEIEDEDWLGF